jgi:TolB-like protein/DNA-binding winged helix-turn-helix (wHTH) protein
LNLDSRNAGFVIADDATPSCWRFGDVELDEHDASVCVDGKRMAMDRSGFDLLRCLMRHAGETVSKEDLMRAGWRGRVVTENSLAKAIGRLRLALNDPDGELLRVVHGFGYRLVAHVERVAKCAIQPALAAAPSASLAPTSMPLPRRRMRMAAMLVASLVLAALAVAAALHAPPLRTANSTEPLSLAVLPFVDLSLAHDRQYFSDGLAEELLDDLAHLPQIKVAARTSSFAFRGQQADIQTIGKQLHVDTVLEGSVRESAGRIRVTVQLIDTDTGYHRWSQTYDRSVTELFAMQDEITRAIINALRIELLPEQMRNLAQRGTDNPDAYQEYLLARYLFKDDETAHRRAIAHLERAVSLDPRYVDASLLLADTLSFSGLYADNAEEALAGKNRAMAILDGVIAQTPDRAEAYFLRAERKYAHWWDWTGARADIELGKARSSPDADAYLRARCRLEAALGDLRTSIALAQRATQLDPQSGWAWTVMGYHRLALGDFVKAQDALTQAVHNAPLDEHAHYYLGLVELLQGRADAALPHFEDSANFLRLTGLALAHHSNGDTAASERDLQLLISRYGHILPYQAAEVYAWRGENDKAFQWLDRSYELHDASFMYLEFDPLLRGLHADARFSALLAKLKLPPLLADIAH